MRGGLDGVDAVEGEAKKAVVGNVVLELRRYGLGELNGLAADGSLADLDNVGIDVTGRGGAVTVRNGPCGAI